MVTSRLERIVGYVRRIRPGGEAADAIDVSPDLPESDLRRLRRSIDQTIEAVGGEVAARRKARAIGASFTTLDATGRRRFFDLLAHSYGGDEVAVDQAIDDVLRAKSPPDRRRAEEDLRHALQPRSEQLFRKFAGLDGGLPFLVGLREELLSHLGRDDDALSALDRDLRAILEQWFDVALLRLEHIRWESSAALLEKLIEYEAVHAIESWDDLKGRLGPGRRCYAFMHPAMDDDPLIFVEVALTRGLATDLPSLLDHSSARATAAEADTAIFYSISNCHRGLAGVSLGDFLIKSVAERLREELPNLNQFATLSPLPGFRRWIERTLADDSLTIHQAEAERLAPDAPDDAAAVLADLISGPVPDPDDDLFDRAKPLLLRLGAHYLCNERRGARALDPVAHFHLSNGATVHQLNWLANPGPAGWERGLGMMVNYRYQLRAIERHHESYVGQGIVTAADSVRKLLTPVEGESRKSR